MGVRVDRAADEVQPHPSVERPRLEDGSHLDLVPLAPVAGIQAQPARAGDPVRSILQTHPFSTSGGITPGWPSATGSGPRVTFVVSMNSTPSVSTRTANRSMPRSAGP